MGGPQFLKRSSVTLTPGPPFELAGDIRGNTGKTNLRRREEELPRTVRVVFGRGGGDLRRKRGERGDYPRFVRCGHDVKKETGMGRFRLPKSGIVAHQRSRAADHQEWEDRKRGGAGPSRPGDLISIDSLPSQFTASPGMETEGPSSDKN